MTAAFALAAVVWVARTIRRGERLGRWASDQLRQEQTARTRLYPPSHNVDRLGGTR
jgi:hypothetical protein